MCSAQVDLRPSQCALESVQQFIKEIYAIANFLPISTSVLIDLFFVQVRVSQGLPTFTKVGNPLITVLQF
jgi:hypothetical protein